MKLVSMDFPEFGVRVTGSEQSVNKKSRILKSITKSYVAYSHINAVHEEIFHLLNKTAADCNTLEMIDMQAHLETLKKGVAEFEEAYSELYEAHIEEEIPNECIDNSTD